jgi:hypothetical protein
MRLLLNLAFIFHTEQLYLRLSPHDETVSGNFWRKEQ